MRTLARFYALAACSLLFPARVLYASPAQSAADEQARWQAAANNTVIVRDDWGIAHVHGKSDADAVFGMIYAQAEDDFNRVETNYLNAMGRLAEAEGESAIYQDLRMKLFIRPDDLQARYSASPPWLKRLMIAWSDGLNFFLHSHPDVEPRVIRRFEPWMALSFSEGSIGGDIERVPLGPLQDFYGPPAPEAGSQLAVFAGPSSPKEPGGEPVAQPGEQESVPVEQQPDAGARQPYLTRVLEHIPGDATGGAEPHAPAQP